MMKSRYYLDYYYCGIAIMHEPKVGAYYREMTRDGRVIIMKYDGKKVGEGYAYAFKELCINEQPLYKKRVQGMELRNEK